MTAAYLICIFVLTQRLFELYVSDVNTRRLLAAGAREHAPEHYKWIVALHTGWLISLFWAVGQGVVLNPLLLGLFAVLQIFRGWVLFALGPYWTTRIIRPRENPIVAGGPYRFLKHPNDVQRISWLGELRYAMKDDRIEIVEANEMSGFYAQVRDNPALAPLPIANDVESIPAALRHPKFKGEPESPSSRHLAHELGASPKNVRHDLNNVMASFLAMVGLLCRDRAQAGDRDQILDLIRDQEAGKLKTLSWLFKQLHEDGLMSVQDYSQQREILDFISIDRGWHEGAIRCEQAQFQADGLRELMREDVEVGDPIVRVFRD